GPPGVVPQVEIQDPTELFGLGRHAIGAFEFRQSGHQRLGDITSAERAEVTLRVRQGNLAHLDRPLAFSMNAFILLTSFFLGCPSFSTPLATSTPTGSTFWMAGMTLSGSSPPARNNGTP